MKEPNYNGAETHPLFPSGDWEGFYTYAMGPQADKHPMQFMLNFKANVVDGSGADDVGGFVWKGRYNTGQLECTMTKYYSTHQVHYQGQVDENGIWGLWEMDWLKGGFHIWPKASAENKEAAAIEAKEAVMVEKVPVLVPKERKF
ncbi:hypothetical protein AAE02nite_33080 [Adhaeribacter aerolatus]|uniref:Uncharacterized protein n=1 Tax=Adhaeribacter aerolatus TaxID=670289 RepID=A0A512B101_9BACT|nr:hypothetical protein [Adhaeribacter aerolatus]GEO05644.1 hypothetical protein AAE02nite_33080 [Adhaeribacter aerolatus]